MASQVWPKSVTDLTFLKQLGRGYFGEVWECKRTSNPAESFAVKKVPMAVIQQHNLSEQMNREVDILRTLRHPNIVELYFEFRDSSHIYLGMQFATGGGMFDLLSRSGKFTNEKAAQYFYEVCDALSYCHGMKVIHRDIKPENILMDGEGHAKLADFGWSNMVSNADLRMTFCGTPDYLAPEMIRGEGHNESLDMWCMGVLLYEMTVGKSPFGSRSQETTCRLILQVDLRFPSALDKDAQNCIVSLCRKNPKERLTADQAKQHDFVKKYYSIASRPTVAVDGADESGARPSVDCRRLKRDRGLLEEEMKQILQAKSAIEEDLMKVSGELEEAYNLLKKEEKARTKFDAEYKKLKEREEEQLREIEALKKRVAQKS